MTGSKRAHGVRGHTPAPASQLLDGVCTQTVQSFAVIWQLTTAIGVFLVLLAVLGTYIVCWRPGCGGPMDLDADEDGFISASVAPAPIIVLEPAPYDANAYFPGGAGGMKPAGPLPESGNLRPVRVSSRNGDHSMPGPADPTAAAEASSPPAKHLHPHDPSSPAADEPR